MAGTAAIYAGAAHRGCQLSERLLLHTGRTVPVLPSRLSADTHVLYYTSSDFLTAIPCCLPLAARVKHQKTQS
jgi:hypothetical protein